MNTSFKSFKAKLIIIKKKFVLKSLHKKILNNQFNSLNGQAKMALMVQFSKLPKIFPEPSLKFRDALSWHFAGDPSLRSMAAMKRPRKLLKDWGGGTLGKSWPWGGAGLQSVKQAIPQLYPGNNPANAHAGNQRKSHSEGWSDTTTAEPQIIWSGFCECGGRVCFNSEYSSRFLWIC